MTECNVVIGSSRIEQVVEFVRPGRLFTDDGKLEGDIEMRVNAGDEVNGVLYAVVNSSVLRRMCGVYLKNRYTEYNIREHGTPAQRASRALNFSAHISPAMGTRAPFFATSSFHRLRPPRKERDKERPTKAYADPRPNGTDGACIHF